MLAGTDVLTTLTTSVLPTSTAQSQHHPSQPASTSLAGEVRIQGSDSSTINGVVIGLLSSFGSAILIAFIFLVIYFFRYTSSGRILLDRIGRPGEYDDEQQFAREEAEALEQMDDLQQAEYLRAKGTTSCGAGLAIEMLT